MGILDGQPFDPAAFQQASEAATPGWLGLALPSGGMSPGLASAGQSFANAPCGVTPASPPPAGPPTGIGNPLTALLGGLGAGFSPAAAPSANGPGLGERANAAVMNFLNGHGVLPAIAGAITGATTGERTDPIGLLQAQQAATARALADAGITPYLAQAAAMNPDIMRLVAPQLVGALQRNRGAAPAAPTQFAPPGAQQDYPTGKTQKG